MGYDVHITRADSWVDGDEAPITLEQWREYVRSDPEMRLDGRAAAPTTEGEFVEVESESLAVWTAYSKGGQGGNHAWFHLGSGCIVVKNPDAEILEKMSRMATHFGARVQGDDGEDYDADGRPVVEGGNNRPWWRRLLGQG